MPTCQPNIARVLLTMAAAALLSAAEARRGAAETQPAPPGTVESGNVPIEVGLQPAAGGRRVALSIASDLSTAYYLRGIAAERNGVIWQPWAYLTFLLFEGGETDLIDNVRFSVGSFNSIHSKQTAADGSGPSRWYESSVIVGPSMTVADHFTASLLYLLYNSPSGAFPTIQELDLNLTVDDSAWLGAWALQPSMLWGFELNNTFIGTQEGIYLQLGVRPGAVLLEDTTYPLTLSMPLALGLSVDNYYEEPGPNGGNDTFGFFDAGLVASVPLTFVPEQYGAWSINASVDILALGGVLVDFNGGHGTQWIGKTGFLLTY